MEARNCHILSPLVPGGESPLARWHPLSLYVQIFLLLFISYGNPISIFLQNKEEQNMLKHGISKQLASKLTKVALNTVYHFKIGHGYYFILDTSEKHRFKYYNK